jgi:hypothetical protein
MGVEPKSKIIRNNRNRNRNEICESGIVFLGETGCGSNCGVHDSREDQQRSILLKRASGTAYTKSVVLEMLLQRFPSIT